MGARLGLLALLTSLSFDVASAQSAASDAIAARRTAVFSALASRATREGVVLPVGLCSVVKAIEFDVEVRAAVPDALASSLTGEAMTCPARGGAQIDEPWRTFIEVASAHAVPAGDAPDSVYVELRVWNRPDEFSGEYYDFVVGPDSLWTPTRLRSGRILINLAFRPDPNVLFLLNNQIRHSGFPADVFEELRGQIVDSVVVIGAKDTSRTNLYGSLAMNGAIIVGAHPPGTPQCERALQDAQAATPRTESFDLLTGDCASIARRLAPHAGRIARGPGDRELRLAALRALVEAAWPDASVTRRWLARARLGDSLPLAKSRTDSAAALRRSPLHELVSLLPALARSDSDPEVRRAARILWQGLIYLDAQYGPFNRDP